MDPTCTRIIACATVIEEMLPLMPAGISYEVFDFGLHMVPGELKSKLQLALDACCSEVDTVLLGYGLCSMAVVGLKANSCTLVLPRVDDCIAIFLGSRRSLYRASSQGPRQLLSDKRMDRGGDSPFDEYERLVQQYGEARAERIMQVMLKHYTRLVYIDTGQPDSRDFVEYVRKTADRFHLNFEEVRGSNALILKMLSGDWDEEFLVIPPGKTIEYLDFKTSAMNAATKQVSDNSSPFRSNQSPSARGKR